MGGLNAKITVEKLPNADSIALPDLQEELWDTLTDSLHHALGRRQNSFTLYEYVGETHEHWSANVHGETGGELWYTFMDLAGCCNLSMEAMVHWFDLALASCWTDVDRRAARNGWKLMTPRPSLARQVRYGTGYPLVYMDGQRLLSIETGRWNEPLRDDALWGDQGEDPPRLSELDAETRAKIERIAITGRCECELCSRARLRITPKVARGQPKPLNERSTYANVPAAWRLFCHDEQTQALARAAAEALTSFDEAQWTAEMFGPPPLRVLDDWLEERGAKVATSDLTRMVARWGGVIPPA